MSITDTLNSNNSSITNILNSGISNTPIIGSGVSLNKPNFNVAQSTPLTSNYSVNPITMALNAGQGIARTVASVGITAGNIPTQIVNNNKLGLDKQSLPFNESIPTSGNPITSAIFGGEPVNTIQKNISNMSSSLEPYIGKIGANIASLPIVAGSIALDLSGFGGGAEVKTLGEIPEGFFKAMAKEDSAGAIEGTLRSVGMDETTAKTLAPQFAETKTAQEAKDVLANFGEKTATGETTPLLNKEGNSSIDQRIANISNIAQQKIANGEGGFSINLMGDEPTSGYMVAPSKATEMVVPMETPNNISITDLQNYAKNYIGQLADSKNHIGGWVNESGQLVLDISRQHDNINDAITTANNGQQDAIYNVKTGQSIYKQDFQKEVDLSNQSQGQNSGTNSGGNGSQVRSSGDQGQSGQIDKASNNIVSDIVGERNTRIAQTNQLRDALAKTLTTQEQEALTFYRDFKDNPTGLSTLVNDPSFEKYKGVINLASNPTPAMLNADKVISGYFNDTLTEGKKLGFLDSSIQSDKYITHLLSPSETPPKAGLFSGAKLAKSTPFAKTRTYETVADAIKAGVNVKSINALDALTIYGDKHAVAASTKIGLQNLKDLGVAKFGYKGAENIPSDWVVADPSNRFFRNTIPFTSKEGKPSFAYQDLYVPPKVAEALKPLVSTNFTGQIPGFTQGRLYQGYLKSVQLGLSVFHLKALNITALNNEGMTKLIISYAKDMTSPEFLSSEVDFVKHGGISPVLGKTMEAYRGILKTSIPSRMDILKKVTGIKLVDSFAKKLTRLTFDIVQRKFKVQDYALKTAKFIAKNSNATDEALVTAKRAIAKEVNAAYGGLNWEVLGWNRATLDITRFLMLAPDWTFSNVLNAKYAFEGGPAGQAARMFWIRSIITGAALTYGMSTVINNKPQKVDFSHFTNVYLGKDKNGKDIEQNLFFAGAPSDAVNLVNNIADYGLIQGFAQSLAPKMSPAIKTGIQLLTNRNYLGQQVVPKGMGPIAGTARSLYTTALGLGPVPFTLSTMAQMFTDPSKQYTKAEYITALAGTKPRHVVPEGMREVTSGSKKGQVVPAKAKTAASFLDQVITGKLNQPASKSSGSIKDEL